MPGVACTITGVDINVGKMIAPSSLSLCLSLEFQRSGVDLTQPVVATCGSGVTAAIIALAAHSLNTTIPLYDVR